MKNKLLILQIALIFIGSIVGAGVCSGRELNQFFATYGISGLIGLVLCGFLYVVFGKIIILITHKFEVRSYNEFVELVCPKWVARFTNIVLTLFLLSSTSIILAGSGAIMEQYFHLPKWLGALIMVVGSIIFLMRKTEGLFEVNTLVVPTLIVIMLSIFITYIRINPNSLTYSYLRFMPRQKTNLLVSTIIYVSFNILTIIGVIVPLTNEIKKPKQIIRGVILGSIILTVIGMCITFLMLVNPFYPNLYEIPMLGIAMEMSKILQWGMLAIIWLEMFSSQISNVYSLSYFLKSKYKMSYMKGVWLAIIVAAPFSVIGFSNLVEFLYPMYGILSLVFLMYATLFFIKNRN